MAPRSPTVDALKRLLYVEGGGERFALRAADEAVGRRLLERAAAGPDAAAEAKAVLRLMVALERRLGSPTAAERLRGWLRDTPALHPHVRRLGFAAAGGADATSAFRAREGRSADRRAPAHGAARPRGAIPLRSLFRDPAALSPPPPRRR